MSEDAYHPSKDECEMLDRALRRSAKRVAVAVPIEEFDSLKSQLSQALRELGEARALLTTSEKHTDEAEKERDDYRVALLKAQSDRDAALRSTAELTRERDRWFMAALGACADSGIATPANAREEFTPESMASEIRRLAYNLTSVTRSTAELRGGGAGRDARRGLESRRDRPYRPRIFEHEGNAE